MIYEACYGLIGKAKYSEVEHRDFSFLTRGSNLHKGGYLMNQGGTQGKKGTTRSSRKRSFKIYAFWEEIRIFGISDQVVPVDGSRPSGGENRKVDFSTPKGEIDESEAREDTNLRFFSRSV